MEMASCTIRCEWELWPPAACWLRWVATLGGCFNRESFKRHWFVLFLMSDAATAGRLSHVEHEYNLIHNSPRCRVFSGPWDSMNNNELVSDLWRANAERSIWCHFLIGQKHKRTHKCLAGCELEISQWHKIAALTSWRSKHVSGILSVLQRGETTRAVFGDGKMLFFFICGWRGDKNRSFCWTLHFFALRMSGQLWSETYQCLCDIVCVSSYDYPICKEKIINLILFLNDRAFTYLGTIGENKQTNKNICSQKQR